MCQLQLRRQLDAVQCILLIEASEKGLARRTRRPENSSMETIIRNARPNNSKCQYIARGQGSLPLQIGS